MLQEGTIYRHGASSSAFTEWLTVERAAYGLAVLVALGVRLWGLGDLPLGSAEAAQSLPAVGAMHGALPDLTGGLLTSLSPLLHALQRVTFSLFGATDGTARFWPALLAGLSPFLFYFLRDRLTPGGALAAAFLWAVSPLGVWSTRLALGDGLVPTLALAVLAAAVWPHRGPTRAMFLGLSVGLLLTAGSNAYTVVVAGLASLAWIAHFLAPFWSELRSQVRFALIGIFASLLVASFLLAEPAGLAATAALPGRWLSDLVPGTGEYGPLEVLWRLLLTELAVVAFGVAGLILAIRRRERFGAWLGVSTALAMAVALTGRGRHPVDLSLVALGLTLLSGPAIASTIRNAYEWRRNRDPWLLVLVSLALFVAAAFSIPSGLNTTNTAAWRSLYVGVGIAALIMVIVVWVAYGVWDSWRLVAVAVPVVPLVFGLAWHAGQMVSLTYDRGAWRQPGILHQIPATDIADLQKLLEDLGGLTGGGRDATIYVAWPDLVTDPAVPVLRWQLRDFKAAQFGASVPPDPAGIVITPVEAQGRLDGYSGEELGVLQRWTPAQLTDFSSTLRWVLYREARTPPEKTRAILWVNMVKK